MLLQKAINYWKLYRNECFCGVSRPLGSPLADSDCDLECPGDGEQKCGAYQAIRVYRTGDSGDL